MSATVVILYPLEPGNWFDVDYYTKSHMTMIAEEFKDYGFKG